MIRTFALILLVLSVIGVAWSLIDERWPLAIINAALFAVNFVLWTGSKA